MYLTATEVSKKYGIPCCHVYRNLVEYGKCRTKKYTFCGRECSSYYEPDIIKIMQKKEAKKKRAKWNYDSRPDVMRGTKSKLKKVIDPRMYKKLQNAWYGMMRRCYSKDRTDYAHYRKFGITICDEWLNSFDEFALWALNNGVAFNLSLDRINNDKGYCPENCRWTDHVTQGNNTSTNVTVRYNGEEKTIAEWAKEYGIKYHTLYMRITRSNWPIEKALTTPSH